MWRRILIAAVVIAGASAVASGALATTGHSARAHAAWAQTASTTAPCGLTKTAPKIKHVVVIMDENNSYGSVYKSPNAPYINSVIQACGLATNYHNITHPSLPEYLAATTGASFDQLTQPPATFTQDCTPSSTCEWKGNNIFHQLSAKGREWRGYAESMPSACGKANSGDYAPRHNPAVYDTDLTNCDTDDIPLGTLSNSPLIKDLSDPSTAPAYAWITPNLCDDMHGDAPGCASGAALIQAGDTWLKHWLPKILSSKTYKAGQTVVLLTWDEGEGGDYKIGEACYDNTTDPSCHVLMVVIAPSVKPGKQVGTFFNHWSLLKTSEQLLGLPQIGQASSAASMVKAFNL